MLYVLFVVPQAVVLLVAYFIVDSMESRPEVSR